MPLFICGFVVLGASLQNHDSLAGVILGWGIAEVAIMMNTVAVCQLFFILILDLRPLTVFDLYCT